jgi:hypothetical protein
VRVDRDVDAVTNWEEGVEPCNEGWMAMEKARDALNDAWSIYSVEKIISEKKIQSSLVANSERLL